MELFRCLVVIATLGLAGCQEDPEEAANRLFVESSSIFTEYHGFPREALEERLNSLEQIQENLQRILSDYPGSSLAVELARNGQIGNIDLSSIERDITFIRAGINCAQDFSACVTNYANIAEIINYNIDGQPLGFGEALQRALIGGALASSGQYAAAYELAETIEDTTIANTVYSSAAIHLVENGEHSEALDLVNHEFTGRAREDLILFLLGRLLQSGDEEGALFMLNNLTNSRRIYEGEAMFVYFHLGNGDVSRARESLERCSTTSQSFRLFLDSLISIFGAPDVLTFDFTDTIPENRYSSFFISQTAILLARRGYFEQAHDVLNFLDPSDEEQGQFWSDALSDVFLLEAQENFFLAIERLRETRASRNFSDYLIYLAITEVYQQGNAEEFHNYIQEVRDEDLRYILRAFLMLREGFIDAPLFEILGADSYNVRLRGIQMLILSLR